MALSEIQIKKFKAEDRTKKIFDSNGLFLQVTPQGGKLWRIKYRFLGKEQLLSLGKYPEISLKDARAGRDSIRRQVAQGINPSLNRKVTRLSRINASENTFEVITREWHFHFSKKSVPSHSLRVLRRFEQDIFPLIGSCPVKEITPIDMLNCLRRIEERGANETAHRALQKCSQVLRYAVSTGRLDRDITIDLKGALAPVEEKHLAAITNPKEVGELLKSIDAFQGTFVVQCALKIAPLVFVRPGELRNAKWRDIYFEKNEWRYLVTKTKSEHIVPLSTQALAILKELQPFTGSGSYIFPSARGGDRPMSDNAILAALRRLEIPKEEMCGHGFRAMARTILDEELNFPVHLIEHQLAHAVKDPNGRAYNRTAHLPQRHVMMQTWSDYLDALKIQNTKLK